MDPFILLAVGMIVVVGGILLFRLHAFLALILGALIVGALTTTPMLKQYAQDQDLSISETNQLVQSTVGERITQGFGRTCAKIGILIAMASIIGKCLLDSGAAECIVRGALRIFGINRAPLAFATSGFVLGIPVFFDTVFYLMIPLGKALAVRTGRHYGLYIMTIVAGATMAHSLVPPTPGPLFVAAKLSIPVGLMMQGGFVVGLFAVCFGYLYAKWANRMFTIPLRDTADISTSQLAELSQREKHELPSLWLSLLPILLPVLLIAGNTVIQSVLKQVGMEAFVHEHQGWMTLVNTLGNPSIALTISAFIALATLVYQQHSNRSQLAAAIQTALASAGSIVLITAAGGAFGGILQQTGIGHRVEELTATYQVGIIPLAFAITALVRTAQGSATVAMITAVGILSGFGDASQLGFHPLYLALAIGCGSKPILWMNDSGFWIICKMTGMSEIETLKTASAMMVVMSVAGLAAIMVLAVLFPMMPPA